MDNFLHAESLRQPSLRTSEQKGNGSVRDDCRREKEKCVHGHGTSSHQSKYVTWTTQACKCYY